MPNTYYQPGAARAARVEDLFGGIAGRYDLINDLQSFGLHRLWKRKLVALAAITPGARALDLCCGTGDVAFRLANAGAEVIGLDFSEPMLAVARARRTAAGTPPEFLRGDALRLPFADNSFDAVTISYGLRNLADCGGGLAEMRRVAKPGGRVLVLDFGKPENRVWRGLYFQYLRWLVPLFGRVFCRNSAAYAYILESLQHYPAQAGVAEQMRQLAFQEVRVHSFLGGMMSINAGRKPPAG